ncbi:MAG TPA: hypothetical protein VK169_14390 [Saprospiraceae bacterium]|nr:hypothetical protein [Saprospiraceae bacterium]
MYWESYNVAKIRGKYLYRFMSKERLEQFLNSGNLWFSRADLFGDKMECFRLSDISGKSFDYDSILSRKKKHLICCFHEGNNESLAMWDTYFRKDKDRRNFSIRFNRAELVNLIESKNKIRIDIPEDTQSLIHGKVLYRSLVGLAPEKVQTKTVKHVAFRKEASFSYEREYRFDIRVCSDFAENGHSLTLDNVYTLNFDILVNPLLNQPQYKKERKYVKSLGFESKLSDSELAKWLNKV